LTRLNHFTVPCMRFDSMFASKLART
jgi:hypothetical protein